MTTEIVEIRYGAHLFGTATPASDEDYQGVFLPAARDILLGRTCLSVAGAGRPKRRDERNRPGDVDRQAHSLQKYLALVAEGQVMALDMLFAPRWAMTRDPHRLWQELVAHRARLVSKRAASFVGYCRTQANRFGIRGTRVHSVREIVAWLDDAISRHGRAARLVDAWPELEARLAVGDLEHAAILHIPHPTRAAPVPHLECCNRKAPIFASLHDARAIYGRVLDAYGGRALAAEAQHGVDWKALSHAVRIGREAIEFLDTGWISFPLRDAAHVLAIKLGELPYARVATEIEDLLGEVETAQARSSLPEEADHAFIEAFVAEAHRQVVCADGARFT